MFQTQLSDLVDLARAFPQTTIVLNHCGGPLAVGPYAGKREGGLRRMADRIREVASLPTKAFVQQQPLGPAGVIEPALQTAETARAANRPTSDLTAYDLALRGIPHVLSRDRERLILARDVLGDAIKLDPHYGTALAWGSCVHTPLDINGWAEDHTAPSGWA